MEFRNGKAVSWNVVVPPTAARIPAQLGTGCRSAYYVAAKEFFSGRGAMIDSGTLAGGTSVALLEGWKASGKEVVQKPFLHAFDMFKCDQSTPEFFRQNFGGTWSEGDDFRSVYERAIEPYADSVSIHAGDLLSVERWDGPRIEVLGVDVWKNESLAEHSVRLFFTSLAVGAIVLQQDYKHLWLPHVHRIMEALSEYFLNIYETDGPGGTVVFQLIRPIESDTVERALTAQRDCNEGRKLAELAAMKAAREDTRAFIEMADCLREAKFNGAGAAIEQLNKVRMPEEGSYMNWFFWQQRRVLVDAIKSRYRP